MTSTILALLLFSADPEDLRDKIVKVVRVKDGDDIIVLVGDRQVDIRLAGIDAPEKKQPFGNRSKEALAALVHEKDVTVETSGVDGFGRTLGAVFVGKLNVNEEMVRTGMAWQFKKYSKSQKLSELEKAARESKVGLWADPSPIPPWDYRKSQAAK